jgi:hypothetical protein
MCSGKAHLEGFVSVEAASRIEISEDEDLELASLGYLARRDRGWLVIRPAMVSIVAATHPAPQRIKPVSLDHRLGSPSWIVSSGKGAQNLAGRFYLGFGGLERLTPVMLAPALVKRPA